jgi:serine/threonine protein kinase
MTRSLPRWLRLLYPVPLLRPVAPKLTFADRYELLEQIGEGGMGVVYKARQRNLERIVAIKMIRQSLVSEASLARFKKEAQLAASLTHRGIVPVYELGEREEGQYYFSMGFIRGPSFAARLKEGPCPVRDAAVIVRDVAEAIQFAHDQGVIHRDLKPGNILLDADQSGRAWVTDFGLARRADVKATGLEAFATVEGSILGTPGYMSPEQASGKTTLVNKPTDIFGLGAILYEALTGQTPFSTSNWLEVCTAPLRPPRDIRPDVPQSLDAICVACLAKPPEERLRAEELVTRLGRFLGDDSTRTYPAAPRDRVPANSDHIVICGLGDLGLRLALEGRDRGKAIVAIEQHGNSNAIEQARSRGVDVIEGDACVAAVLCQARADKAQFIVAACQEDQTNIEIAVQVGKLLSPALKRREPLVCRLVIANHDLLRWLADRSRFPPVSAYRINFSDLNWCEAAARQAVRRYPLDFEPIGIREEMPVHLIVVGFGSMGQSFALRAARLGHFANAVTGDRRLRITVVDWTESGLEEFRERFPAFEKICDLRVHRADPHVGLAKELAQITDRAHQDRELVTYAVCLENDRKADDDRNWKIGTQVSECTMARPMQVLIYQSTRRGMAGLLTTPVRSPGLSPRLHAFGMKEDIFSWDTLLHESEDLLAQSFHQDYERQRRNEGVPDSKNPGWSELEEDFRDSNRQAADHIDIKLRALGYYRAPIQSNMERSLLTEAQVVLLAKIEHLRWTAERLLGGWRWGPERLDGKKVHPCLVPWDELPAQQQTKDIEQINAIPIILDALGEGIYR